MKPVGKYYVIDPQKEHTRPPFEYEEVYGSEEAFTEINDRTRIQLPKDPVQFAGMLRYVKNQKNLTMGQYALYAKKYFNQYYSNGAFFIYLSIKRFESNWYDIPIEIPQNWNQFVKGVEKAIESQRSRLQSKGDRKIDPKVVQLYFKEVLEHGPE